MNAPKVATAPHEVVFEDVVDARATKQMTVVLDRMFRYEELVVMTPTGFWIRSLFADAWVILLSPDDMLPASVFAETAHPEMRYIRAVGTSPNLQPGQSLALIVVNNTDDASQFKAFIKGLKLVDAPQDTR